MVDTALVYPFKGNFTGVAEVEFNVGDALPVNIDEKNTKMTVQNKR